jgi:hypothetical protein
VYVLAVDPVSLVGLQCCGGDSVEEADLAEEHEQLSVKLRASISVSRFLAKRWVFRHSPKSSEIVAHH